MSGAGARAALALKARVLDAVGAPAKLGPRARRLSRRLADRARGEPTAPVAFADVAALPDWASWPPTRLRTFVDLAGAMACAPALHRTVDGKLLRRLAGRIGEDALDAVLALPPGLIPPAPCEAALASDEGLRAVGAAVLLSEAADRPALSARLARLLDIEPRPLPPAVGLSALQAARGGLMALEAGRMEVTT
jgi:hypothetical protein